jgi:hypothetical protein
MRDSASHFHRSARDARCELEGAETRLDVELDATRFAKRAPTNPLAPFRRLFHASAE